MDRRAAVMLAVGIRSDYNRAQDAAGRREKAVHPRSALGTRRALFQEALITIDVATVIIAFTVSYYLAATVLLNNAPSLKAYVWLLWAIVPMWVISLRWCGFYDSQTYSSLSCVLGQLLRAHIVAALLLLSTMYATKAVVVSRLLMQTFLTVSFAILAGEKSILHALLKRRRWRPSFNCARVLLVGSPENTARYLKLLERNAWMSAQIVGLLTSCTAKALPRSDEPAAILGEPNDLPEVLNSHVVDEVIALLPLEEREFETMTSSCESRGVIMRVLLQGPPTSFGTWRVDDCGEGVFFMSLAAIPQDAFQLAAKRLMDIIGGMAGLTLLALAAAVYSRRIRRETGGTTLFRQQRVGRNGRLFTLYKFRTMYDDAEQRLQDLLAFNEMKGPMFKIKHDPRVTPTGAKLRRRHLDELPQFWNVLKGEMSLVGTRPPTQNEIAEYRDAHRRRLSMKPGLTGLWQMNGNHSVNDFEEVVALDCEYINNWSLALDINIILGTIKKVMRGNAW
jgi:exopolysaccharide biosynthesis polyprenyl glycosylphosphotransferase